MIEISVIIPVYNSEFFLDTCLKSICLQNYNDIEIICINDGSSDNSLAMLEKWAKKDSRIKILNQENKGASAARNKGLECANGNYIHFMDSDDWVSLGLYKRFFEENKNENVDIYMFNGTYHKEKYENNCILTFFDIRKWMNFKESKIHTFDDLTTPFDGNMSICNKIYKKTFLEKNNIKFKTGTIFEDQIFYLESHIKAESILLCNEPIYKYRQNVESQVTSTFNRNGFDIFDVIDDMENFLIKEGKMEEYKYAFLQHKYQQFSYIFFRINDIEKEKFFNIAKEKMKNIKFESYDKNILNKLINNKIISDFLNLDYKSFYNKNKILYL